MEVFLECDFIVCSELVYCLVDSIESFLGVDHREGFDKLGIF